MKDDSNKDQKEKILKEQMDELIDQGFKDAAQNQRILTPKNKKYFCFILESSNILHSSPKNKTKQGSPKKGLMKLKTIRDAKMGYKILIIAIAICLKRISLVASITLTSS